MLDNLELDSNSKSNIYEKLSELKLDNQTLLNNNNIFNLNLYNNNRDDNS